MNKKIIYSRSSHTDGFLLKRLASNIDNADLVVAAIAFVIFLFDCHFLFLMRLDYYDTGVNVTNIANQSSQIGGVDGGEHGVNSDDTMMGKSLVLICYPSQERSPIYYDFYTRVYIWIDQFLYSYIPFAIMIVSTIIIIHRLITINKQLKSKTTTSNTTNITNTNTNSSTNNNTPSKQQPKHMNGNKSYIDNFLSLKGFYITD